MSITSVSQWQIFCITENQVVTGWGPTFPTVCYHNSAHTVNPNSWQLIQTITSDQVTIKQNPTTVGSAFWVKDIEFKNVVSQTSQTTEFTFDIPVCVYGYDFFVDDTNVGDYMTIIASPDTVLGLITQNVSIGDVTLYAPAGLLGYGHIGYEIKITDGTNMDDLGRMKIIDKSTGIVTFTNASTHNYSSANTIVMMNYYVMKNYTISGYGQVRYGDNVITATAIPAGTTVRYIYQNNSVPGDLTDAPKNFRLSFSAQF